MESDLESCRPSSIPRQNIIERGLGDIKTGGTYARLGLVSGLRLAESNF